MPAAAMKRMGKKLRSQKDLARQQYQQYGGKLARKAGAGGVSAAVMPDRGPMPSDMGGRGRIDMGPTPDQGMMGQAGEVIRRRRQAEMPAPGAGQPEMAPNMQGPATAPPEPAAAPIPAGGPDMGPTPKGVMDAGAGAGGRLTRPGTGLIRPAAAGPGIRPIAGGEAVPAAMPVQAQAAPMARMLAQRQPMSGFQRKKPQRRPGRFFSGGGGAQGMM